VTRAFRIVVLIWLHGLAWSRKCRSHEEQETANKSHIYDELQYITLKRGHGYIIFIFSMQYLFVAELDCCVAEHLFCGRIVMLKIACFDYICISF